MIIKLKFIKGKNGVVPQRRILFFWVNIYDGVFYNENACVSWLNTKYFAKYNFYGSQENYVFRRKMYDVYEFKTGNIPE